MHSLAFCTCTCLALRLLFLLKHLNSEKIQLIKNPDTEQLSHKHHIMKFFHALIILAASGGVATAKDSSTSTARARDAKGQERDRKRFLRIKQAESARRSLEGCFDGPPQKPTDACCIKPLNPIGGGEKSGKAGIIVLGLTATVGCAEVCRPLCAVENSEAPPEEIGGPGYPPDTCIVETGGADKGAC